MIRALLMELQRWNNQRVAICDHCGRLAIVSSNGYDMSRYRTAVIANVARYHMSTFPAHVVKVSRFG